MSESSNFAAIWPLKSNKKSEYEIVSVSWIKNYKELKNHGQNLYKYKPPGAMKSSLAFILATGCKFVLFDIIVFECCFVFMKF